MPRRAAEGRPNQTRRTRKALLEAAARLMGEGRKPSLEEVAEAAMVSRATAYRYFPGLDALLLEAGIDMATPVPEAALAGAPARDPAARLTQVDAALDEMIRANAQPLRLMLAQALEHSAAAGEGDPPARQNRRSALIDAALSPAAAEFTPAALDRLKKALAILIGPEGWLVTEDVLQLGRDEAAQVKTWAIEALVAAALAER